MDFGSFYMSVQDLQSAKCVIAQLNCCDSNSLTAHRLSLISPSCASEEVMAFEGKLVSNVLFSRTF